ncbi:MAG: PrgI family protein [Candidatus Pacebacteria bacterium]|nr:PrgI family protein [Candidatus Paceibacterota bacterium]
MQFQVPQFIEVEDKIFGPLTLKQFIYLVGGAGFSFALYTFLPKFIAFALMAPVLGLSIALAFYKINGKPFVLILESAFKYIFGNKLYIWKKEPHKKKQKKESVDVIKQLNVPRLSESKLKDLSWSLDVQDK